MASGLQERTDLRNVAIIAHVDHGKTTLVDQLMRQSGLFRESELRGECILDSNELERQRGITILAKNIALNLGGTKVNIIDTPGHADFGGEVERVLKMADGALLLVDAAEGPLPQTRFVLRKAFECGLRPIVVINKIDRPDARPVDTLNAVFDLFVELDADDATLDFTTIYASGRHGVATTQQPPFPEALLKGEGAFASAGAKGETASTEADGAYNIRPLYDAILKHVPPPIVDPDSPLQMLVVTLDWSDYVGRIAIGRVVAGKIKKNQKVALLKHDGTRIDAPIKQLYVFDRLGRIETDEVAAGDICAVVGLEDVDIGDTIADFESPVALPPITVDEPTLDMIFRINDSPFAGLEGTYVTSRQLRDRLDKELQSNVALRVVPSEEKRDEFHVSGRGLLHLGILLENMRREGYELSVGKPRVITRQHNGQLQEPIEYLVVDVPPSAIGPVMELVGNRRAECLKMDSRGDMAHLEFTIPSRGLIGLRTRLLNATSGQAIMHHTFYDYQAVRGSIPSRINGVMVCTEMGRTTAHALEGLQERGTLFVGPAEQVYWGKVVDENCRDKDLPVNACREKKLTNVRSATAEKTILLKPPRLMSLEQALEYIEEDEYVEITPKSVRLRKILLKEADRRRYNRQLGRQEE